MKRVVLTILVISAFIKSNAQDSGGVHFEKGSWQEVLAKAKQEHKYIFVDCYASWCGPCKMMDQQVYPDAALGKFVNDLFVSIKVQMDTSKKDSEYIRNWYADAHQIMADNNVNAYPSFLFFNPDGKIVHKEVGYQDVVHFLQMAFAAKDPDNQEYVLLTKYKEGKLPDTRIPTLIALLTRAGEKDAAEELTEKYIQVYILKLPDELLYKRENIEIMGSTINSSTDKIFNLFYQNAEKIDQATQKNYAENILINIIAEEEVYATLWADRRREHLIVDQADWDGLHEKISKKYNSYYADQALINPKIDWGKQKKEWQLLTEAYMKKMERYALDDKGDIISMQEKWVNNVIYSYIFKYSDDKILLAQATDWIKKILARHPDNPDNLDTYANLLYKSGNKKEAIKLETKAFSLDPTNKEISENIEKMKQGKPTWFTN